MKTDNWRQPFQILAFVVGLVVAIPAHAETVTVDFSVATEWDNGDPFPRSDIRSTRFYCDGSIVPIAAIGGSADGQFVFDLADGSHPCYAAHTIDRSVLVAKHRDFYNDPTFDPACLEADVSSAEICIGNHVERIIIIGARVIINVNGPTITITVQP